MKVNSRVFTEKTDMLDSIRIPTCPSEIRDEVEKIMMMVTKPGYSVRDYINVTHLDKLLTLDYWREYDGLKLALYEDRFDGWFVSSATSADLISRAIRWLVSHNYIFLKPEVQRRALEASDKWRQSVRH